MRKKLGECLVQAGLITEDELRTSLAEQKRTREHLGVILTRNGIATESQIAQTVALQLGLPFVNLSHHEPDPATLSLIPQDVAIRNASAPTALHRHVLTVAMADPLILGFVQDLESQTGYRVRQVVASRTDISQFIARAYATVPGGFLQSPDAIPAARSEDDQGDAFDTDGQLAAVVDLIAEPGVTEVRLEPGAGGGVVSRRADGVLHAVATFSHRASGALLARLKQRACMDPEERMLAQDGRLRLTGSDGSLRTILVATRREDGGEVAVLRSGVRAVTIPPATLGLSRSALDALRALSTRSGLLLVSAPPASGASTTARSLVDAWEDPALLFGDIDDTESAGAALSAAREGRLVLASIQAEDTASAVDRLIGLSWSPGLVAEVLAGVMSQRLVRRLCDRCRRTSAASEGWEAACCAQCGYAGYRGRVAIFEVLPVSNEHRPLIAQGGAALRAAGMADGMATLAEDGLSKVRAGVVRFADVSRVVSGLAGARRTCPACGSVVDNDRAECGYCGHRLLGTCLFCGRPLQPEWGICPYCTRSVVSGTVLERLS